MQNCSTLVGMVITWPVWAQVVTTLLGILVCSAGYRDTCELIKYLAKDRKNAP